MCAELDLWHAVDPFAERTATPRRCYFRLHGRKGWRYSYEDAELEELRRLRAKFESPPTRDEGANKTDAQ